MVSSPAMDRGVGRAGRVLCAACGAALAAAEALGLARALSGVANREALAWDAARRALLDLEAADALRRLDVAAFLWRVVGPETWPTLRLLLAAPLHALAGPPHAFGVELGLSVAAYAALPLLLALVAADLARSTVEALVAFALGAALLLGNRALLIYAADGMLEPLSALFTLGSVWAWIASRRGPSQRPVALALLGNLLFHVKWQYGMLLALAVLGLETWEGGLAPARRRTAVVVRALAAEGESAVGRALLALGALFLAAALYVARAGGTAGTFLGIALSFRDVHGPVAWLALVLFAFVERALYRGRARLALQIPERLRFLWAFLATPMAAWILVPFTWRLRTLVVTAAVYHSGASPPGLAGRLLFYPLAAFKSWLPKGAGPVLLALLAASAWAALRSREVRRLFAPVVALAAVEGLVLAAGSRHNFQARFALNLAPLLALGAGAFIAALPRGLAWIALPASAALALLLLAAPLFREGALAAALSEGFDPEEHALACRRLAEAIPPGAVILNGGPQGCALWAAVLARQAGRVAEFDVRARPEHRTLFLISDCLSPPPVPEGFVGGDELEAGPFCGRVCRRAGPGSP